MAYEIRTEASLLVLPPPCELVLLALVQMGHNDEPSTAPLADPRLVLPEGLVPTLLNSTMRPRLSPVAR